MDKPPKELLQEIFEASVDKVRESIRERHVYGFNVTPEEKIVLSAHPKKWKPDFLSNLEEAFLEECMESEMIIASFDDLVDKFCELIDD